LNFNINNNSLVQRSGGFSLSRFFLRVRLGAQCQAPRARGRGHFPSPITAVQVSSDLTPASAMPSGKPKDRDTFNQFIEVPADAAESVATPPGAAPLAPGAGGPGSAAAAKPKTVWRCKYCPYECARSTSATRLRAHFVGGTSTGCPKAPPAVLEKLVLAEKLRLQAKEKKAQHQAARDAIDQAMLNNTPPLNIAFDASWQRFLDQATIKLIADSGLPMSFVKNPAFKTFVNAVRSIPTGIAATLPSPYKLGGPLLDGYYDEVKKEVDCILNSVDTITLSFDSWTAPNHHNYTNFLANTSKGPVYLETVDGMGQDKTAEYYASVASRHVETFGRKVLLVTTDSPSVNVAMWQLLEAKFPWVTGGSCLPHSINSFLKDACKLEPISTLIGQAKEVVLHIMNHQFTHALFTNNGSRTVLYKPADTRYATHTRTHTHKHTHTHAHAPSFPPSSPPPHTHTPTPTQHTDTRHSRFFFYTATDMRRT
jgi:hypothetical protein